MSQQNELGNQYCLKVLKYPCLPLVRSRATAKYRQLAVLERARETLSHVGETGRCWRF
jgi:hypothetical protein